MVGGRLTDLYSCIKAQFHANSVLLKACNDRYRRIPLHRMGYLATTLPEQTPRGIPIMVAAYLEYA